MSKTTNSNTSQNTNANPMNQPSPPKMPTQEQRGGSHGENRGGQIHGKR